MPVATRVWAAVLAVAPALALVPCVGLSACKSTPFGGEQRPFTSAGEGAEPRDASTTPAGTPPTAPLVTSSDPLGLPAPPPGSRTSDSGSRIARPTPIGQIAPEEAPRVPVTPR